MTPEWLEKIRVGGKLFYENRLKPNLGWAYRQTLARFFIKDKVIENGRERIITLDPYKGEIFTQAQFRYHYLQNRDPRLAAWKRLGPTFRTDHRKLWGKSIAKGTRLSLFGRRYLGRHLPSQPVWRPPNHRKTRDLGND